MKTTDHNCFEAGDTVKTKEPEMDIELIPAGTKIVLTCKSGERFWRGYGSLNGMERDLLLFASNLQIVKKHMDDNPKS